MYDLIAIKRECGVQCGVQCVVQCGCYMQWSCIVMHTQVYGASSSTSSPWKKGVG